jgi:hypothetical protein
MAPTNSSSMAMHASGQSARSGGRVRTQA